MASFRAPQPKLARVVGDDTNRENDARYKRALVLSPFEFEFNILAAGQDTAQALQSIPDYLGRVTFLQNQEVGISAFQGWDQYDFIMYNGHGGIFKGLDRRTGHEIRSTFITTGDEQVSCALQGSLQDLGVQGGYPKGIGR